jgi:tetratricopeptide (TPR) repeat protein
MLHRWLVVTTLVASSLSLGALQSAPPSAAAGVEARLASLEAAVAAAPDNLRAANDYRMAIIQAKQYDRALAFFGKLVESHPDASSAHLNYGFAYVDKIPDAGAITQVILANSALGEFTKAIQLEPSWIGYYTRGNSYLFWPKIFRRTSLGIADLEAALGIQKAQARRPYHVRVYIALGDGYWMMEQAATARATWADGIASFPESGPLKTRLSASPGELETLFKDAYDSSKRVNTSLEELWTSGSGPGGADR